MIMWRVYFYIRGGYCNFPRDIAEVITIEPFKLVKTRLLNVHFYLVFYLYWS